MSCLSKNNFHVLIENKNCTFKSVSDFRRFPELPCFSQIKANFKTSENMQVQI